MAASLFFCSQDQLDLEMFHNSLPLCNRWDYKIATASYGYVHLENQTKLEGSESWSRVRILFPTASFMYRKEQPTVSPYVIVCDLGGAMSVYIGVSIISFVQLSIYGIYVCCVVAKKRLGKYFQKGTRLNGHAHSRTMALAR